MDPFLMPRGMKLVKFSEKFSRFAIRIEFQELEGTISASIEKR